MGNAFIKINVPGPDARNVDGSTAAKANRPILSLPDVLLLLEHYQSHYHTAMFATCLYLLDEKKKRQ